MLCNHFKKSSLTAWSPNKNHPYMVAFGSSGGVLNDDFQSLSQLEIIDIRKSNKGSLLSAPNSFSSIAWGPSLNDSLPSGIIAGGMDDGSLVLWDPLKILNPSENDSEILSQISHSDFTPSSLSFSHSPQKPLLAAASKTSPKITIFDLATLSETNLNSTELQNKFKTGIHNLEWNSKVPHILAIGTSNGVTSIWDLRQNKAVINIKKTSDSESAVQSISWNPAQALQISTSYGTPEGELWDLRNAQKPQVLLRNGESKDSINCIAWNPHDSNLLISSGESQVSFWGNSGEFLHSFENPLARPVSNPTVVWSPVGESFFSVGNPHSETAFYSAVYTGDDYVPLWLENRGTTRFAATGELISSLNDNRDDKTTARVSIKRVEGQSAIGKKAADFEKILSENRCREYCEEMGEKGDERQMWRFIAALFAEDYKKAFLSNLGYGDLLEDSAADPAGEDLMTKGTGVNLIAEENEVDAEAFFNSMTAENEEDRDEEIEAVSEGIEEDETNDFGAVRRNVVVGNFRRAVDECIRKGEFADALIISSCNSHLWRSTQQKYLSNHKNSFMKNIMPLLMENKVESAVKNTKLGDWKQTLAISLAYSAGKEHHDNCNELAERLRKEGNNAAALLCYICAENIDGIAENSLQNCGGDLESLASTAERVLLCAVAISKCDNDKVRDVLGRYTKLIMSEGNRELANKLYGYFSSASSGNETNNRSNKIGVETGVERPVVKSAPYSPRRDNETERKTHFPPKKEPKSFVRPNLKDQAINRLNVNTPKSENLPPKKPLPMGNSGSDKNIAPKTTITRGNASFAAGTKALPKRMPQQRRPEEQIGSENRFPPKPQAVTEQKPFVANGTNPLEKKAIPQKDSQRSISMLKNLKSLGSLSAEKFTEKRESLPPKSQGEDFEIKAIGNLQPPHSTALSSLNRMIRQLSGFNLSGMEKRKLQESKEKIEILKGKMMDGKVSENTAQSIENLSKDLVSGDFVNAKKRQVDLITNEWGENKEWLAAINTLLLLSKRHCK